MLMQDQGRPAFGVARVLWVPSLFGRRVTRFAVRSKPGQVDALVNLLSNDAAGWPPEAA